MFKLNAFINIVFTSIVIFSVSSSQAQLGDELECQYLSAIEQGFLTNHVKVNQRDKVLADRTLDQYLKSMDPIKIYLLQSDVDEAKKLVGNVFDRTKSKDCGFLEQLQKKINSRIQERVEFAKKFLDKTYKFDNKAEFVFDSDKRVYAKNSQELDDFFKKYIHFQISNYLATDMKLEEAKSNVLKNYERALKRTKEVKITDLYANYLDAFARAMDPHSSFFSKDYFEDFNIQMSLSLEGIGATLSSQDGFTVVEYLVPGGAAAKSGLVEPQDKIVAVGQEKGPMDNVIDMDLKDVVKKIRGKKGTQVRLTLLRKEGESKKRMDITLTREKVNLEDDAASIIYQDKEVDGKKKKIGIIQFPSFYSDSKKGGRSSAADLKKIIKEANEKKVDGLVLDLSTNGGGSLEDAVKIAGLFFKTGNVVKQSARGEGRGESALADSDSTVDWSGPLVVLISRISASASEIVAGTLQDYKRAVIVGGDHTFGKGTVQQVLPIPNNLGAIKVTVGMFYIPGGNSTQNRGVDADIPLPSQFSQDDVGEKFLDYSLPSAKISPFISNEAYQDKGEGAWQKVDTKLITTLKQKSESRVSKNDDFKKIIDDMKKAKERGKLVKVSEILKDKDEKTKKDKEKALKNAGKDQRNKEYLKRADIQEALNVITDLTLLEQDSQAPKNQAKK